MADSLKKKVVNGVIWNGLERFGTSFFLFISNLILARLLSPDDFGCIGMLMVFISISNAIVDGGFGAAIIQKKVTMHTDLSTTFIWNCIISILLYLLLFFTAPLISSFYNMQSLSLILRVQGLMLLFNGLSIIKRCILQKELKFKKLAKINLVSTIAGTVLAVICAYIGLGVWSIVAKLLATSIMVCVALWMFSKWTPTMDFSITSLKSLFRFGSFVFLESITSSIYRNFISLIIGKKFSPSTLGYFTQAKKLEDVPRFTITSIISNISFPAFSKIQDDQVKLINAYRKSLRLISYTNFTLTVLLILIAKPLVLILFTKKWLPSVSFFQIICFYGLFMSFIDLNQGLLKALGKGSLLFSISIVRRTIAIILMILGSYWGIKGLLSGYILGQAVSFVMMSYPLKNLIGYGLKQLIQDMAPSFSLSVVCGLIVFFLIPHANNATFLLLSQSSLFLFLFFTASFLLKTKEQQEIINVIKGLFTT